MLKKTDSAALLYWGEPDIAYFVKDVTWWKEDRDVLACDKKSTGYLPIYETYEDAAAAHPGCDVVELMIMPVETH
jgi:hypothetical protein